MNATMPGEDQGIDYCVETQCLLVFVPTPAHPMKPSVLNGPCLCERWIWDAGIDAFTWL